MISKLTSKTPVLILAFNRPKFLSSQLELIKSVGTTKIYVSIDGKRNEYDSKQIDKILKILDSEVTWDCELHVHQIDKNLGCKKAVTEGISWFFSNEDRGIILEDDILPDFSFFQYCSELLNRYKDNKQILLISGDNFFPEIPTEADYDFIKHTPIWGWASWSDRWNNHIKSLENLTLKLLKKNKDKFTINQYKLIEKTLEGKINSWAYLLFFTLVMNDQMVIIPKVHLVSNLGSGTASTHTKLPLFQFMLPKQSLLFPINHPKEIKLNLSLSSRSNILYSRFHLLLKTLFNLLKKPL